MRCIEQTEIARFLSGSMEQELAAQVERHLASCERCRQAADQARVALEDASGAGSGVAEEQQDAPERSTAFGSPPAAEAKEPGTREPTVLDRVRKQWFLVIKRQRVGPLTEREVQERLEQGQIKGRTYAWRKGYKGWQRLASIPEFRQQAHKQQRGETGPAQQQGSTSTGIEDQDGPAVSCADATKPIPSGQAQALVAKLAQGEELDEATLERRPDVARGYEEGRAEVPAAGQMFEPVAEEDADPELERMKAQRRESSVLFSLGHLKQLSQASALPKERPQAGGFTGLFDIRPLATLPPPILVAEEQAPPVGFGWQALLAVGLAGLLTGAGMIVGAILLWAPELVDPLLGRLRWSHPPAVNRVESGPALQRQESGPAAVPAPPPLLPQVSPIIGEDAAAAPAESDVPDAEQDPAAASQPDESASSGQR